MLLFLALVIVLINVNIFSRFLYIFLLSYIAVKLTYPVYKLLLRKTKSVAISTTLSFLLILLFIIIPTATLFILVINEASTIATNLQFGSFIENFEQLQLALNNLINSINISIANAGIDYAFARIDIVSSISTLNSSEFVQSTLIPFFRGAATFSGEFIFGFFLFTISILFIFPIFDKLPDYFTKFSPLNSKYDKLIFSRFDSAIHTVIIGSVGVAMIQSSAVLAPLLILGVGAPILLWIIMLLLSILPIGSGLVWGPIGIAYIVNGITTANTANVILGIFVILYSAIIINVIDAYFRPKFMKQKLNLHPIILIFSVVGGISTFGIMGILLGPVSAVMLVTIFEILKAEYHFSERDNNQELLNDK